MVSALRNRLLLLQSGTFTFLCLFWTHVKAETSQESIGLGFLCHIALLSAMCYHFELLTELLREGHADEQLDALVDCGYELHNRFTVSCRRLQQEAEI